MTQSNKKTSVIGLKRGFLGDKLYADLKKHIASAAPHQAIAGERRLAEKYGVSLMTAHNTVDRLVQEKLLYKIHGKGTFVQEKTGTSSQGKTILYLDDWGETSHPFYMRKLKGILDAAESHGFRIQVHTCPNFDAQGIQAPYLNVIETPDIAGLLIPWLNDKIHAEIKRRNKNLQIVTAYGELRKDTALVCGNPFSTGRQAVQYLSQKNARRIAIVYKHPAMLKGAAAVLHETHHNADFISINWKPDQEVHSICKKIQKFQPDGLLFGDDRLAFSVFQNLSRENPKLLNNAHMISIANAGEDLLPPEFARLNEDGYDIGKTSILILKDMIEGKSLLQSVIQVDPKFMAPLATSMAH